MFLTSLALTTRAASVTLAWDPSTDPEVLGYRVYYGVASRTYTNQVDAGPNTSVTVSNLVPATTYYFAATAYDLYGLESDFSPEVVYFAPANLTITLGNLVQIYDGTSKNPTVTTAPAGGSVSLSYNGAASAPTEAGSYTVVATSADPAYHGSVTNTLVVSPAPAAVILGNLAQQYDSTPKYVTVATSPTNLPVAVTYAGTTQAPKAPGSYAVVATITSPNYAGSATGTMTIATVVQPPPGLRMIQLSWTVQNVSGMTVYESTNLTTWTALTNAAPSASAVSFPTQTNSAGHFYIAIPTGQTQAVPLQINVF